MALIDTHTHIHFDAYAGQVDAVLHRAFEAGVSQLISVGVSTADSRKAVELASAYENVWAAVGIHPHEAGEAVQGTSYIRELAERRKVIAIGECGLDALKSSTTPAEQETALRLQIELALDRKLPLIFHVREAFDEFLTIISSYEGVSGIVHSFSASRREVELVVEHGLMVGINGIATFANSQSLQEAVKQIPENQLVLETDCPFLSPVPYRGETNEPARVVTIAEKVAALRGETAEQVAEYTATNARRLFGI